MGKLADALRRRFRNPAEALAALGLDADEIIGEGTPTMSRNSKTRLGAFLAGMVAAHTGMGSSRSSVMALDAALAGVTSGNFHRRKEQVIADLKRTLPNGDLFAIRKYLDSVAPKLAMDAIESEQSPEERQRQKNAERAEQIFSAMNDAGLANMPDAFKKLAERLFSLAKLGGGADDAESEEDREGRDGAAVGKDMPPPFPGRPTPGGPPLASGGLAPMNDKGARDRALAMDRQIGQRARATAAYFERPWNKDAARIRIAPGHTSRSSF